MSYLREYDYSIQDPEGFWLKKAELIEWVKEPKVALAKDVLGVERWYPDGMMNTCFNAIDRHVLQGKGNQAAIFFDSPVTSTKKTITYSELKDQVSSFAAGLAAVTCCTCCKGPSNGILKDRQHRRGHRRLGAVEAEAEVHCMAPAARPRPKGRVRNPLNTSMDEDESDVTIL